MDCSKDIIEEVLTQGITFLSLFCYFPHIFCSFFKAQQIGMVSEDHFYLLTSLDAHTVDLHSFKYGGTNFTAFRMIDTNHYEVKQVIKDIVTSEMNQGNRLQIENGNLDTTTALIYDAVHLFALALDELSKIQEINIVPINCDAGDSWEHGSSLINYMKLREFTGLSGRIKFDTQGLRTLFDIGK